MCTTTHKRPSRCCQQCQKQQGSKVNTLEDHSQNQESGDVRTGVPDPGSVPSGTAQIEVRFGKRSSRKNHPYKDACTQRTTISASVIRNILISISFSYQGRTPELLVVIKAPHGHLQTIRDPAEQHTSAACRVPGQEALLWGRKQPS